MIESSYSRGFRVIRRLAIGTAIVLLATSASAANKDIARLQFQVSSLQTQLADTQRLIEESSREIKRLNELMADQNATLSRSILEEKAQNEGLAATLRDILEQIAELKEKAIAVPAAGPLPAVAVPPPSGTDGVGSPSTGAGPASAPGGQQPAPVANVPAPRELYSQAYADYARGNYDLAIAAFQEYIRSYPGTDFTDNAQYWIGECLYGKKLFAEAVDSWNALFRDYPASDKLPDARVKKGMALERLGRRSQALVEYRFVIDRFPNSPAARIAREKMNP
jgi:tol-pal system protein YbgF